ncbi:hypothetical protein [Salipiger mangrovisoli]|uniref:STAS/SEC14 domain-containing protein n=1 Tax=Salipiger mangrovisoli TaxID=2865933 RepID=A0ABR9WWS5_9RHOB|nr:hypothetical protein [Salipiger mangrovisoli]MBE9635735.1 hypothetical protein [Salipiger mangrovisoli]
MSGEFRIFAERGLVYLNFSGETHIDECLETLTQLAKAPEWRPQYGLLVDNSRVTTYHGDFPDMQRFGEKLEGIWAFAECTIRVAYYSPSDLSFGVARMAQQVLAKRLPLDIHVFRDEAGALALLGQAETQLSELFATTA